MNFHFARICTILLLTGSTYLVAASHQTNSLIRHGSERELACDGVWQYLSSGTCRNCPTGQVVNRAGTGCEYCPAGTARGANGGALSACINVSAIPDESPCPEPWQFAQYGMCQTCPTGQVGNALKSSCVYCPSGTARGASGTDTITKTGCVNVTTADPSPCPNAWQYAQYGMCQTCPTGQVGNALKSSCVYCPSGTARGANGTDLSVPGGCVNVTTADPSPCPNAWQYAQYGMCQTCPTGQVGNALKSSCVYCPSGTARGANGTDFSEPGGCVNVTTADSSPCPNAWQYAQYGMCQTCPAGQVGNALKSGCNYCPSGTARGANGAAFTDCEAATGVCPNDWQYAQYGRCQNCPVGQNSNSLKTGCEYCPPGSIRGNASGVPFASCAGICAKWQHAQYGACQNCPTGQVGGNGNVGCQYCAVGTVRGSADGKAFSGCVDAAVPCNQEFQYAQYGACQTCPAGQVHKDKKGCQYCPPGTVRGAAGTAASGCVPAAGTCLPSQYGQYGMCLNCPIRQVPKDDRTGCK